MADVVQYKRLNCHNGLGIKMNLREHLKDKKRVVIKVGTSSLTHPETGMMDLIKLEKLVRELSDLHNQGKEVILVSSGAIAVGRKTIGMKERPRKLELKQACASIGQARLMMIYQKLFMEYNQIASQILMTKNTFINGENRINARNTFETLLSLGAIPIVNENDTISTYEIRFGDNDTLSAIVTALVEADLLILLSDIDGLFTDDPNMNPNAEFIEYVDHIDRDLEKMAKGAASDLGTGGMSTKLHAAQIAWFITVENPESDEITPEGRPDYMWFGLSIFDNRSDGMEDGHAPDFGTKKLIYSIGKEKTLGEPVELGKTYTIKYDILPEVKKAFEMAQGYGFLQGAEFDKMEIGSMNLGWELPGIFDVSFEIDKISIAYKPLQG